MWLRKRLDIGWSDLALGVFGCLRRGDALSLQSKLESHWSAADDALACLSVRSGFDLLLGALALPPGSEVLISAVTIADMVRIIKDHGLVPVPIDLEVGQMGPRMELLRQTITPAARAIVVAHLFGGQISLEPLLQLAKEHKLLVIEDCAQGFAGKPYRGHPAADVSMFSFGPIKTATALGGGILRMRDVQLLSAMRSRQAGYLAQGRGVYLRRLLKYTVLKLLSVRSVVRAVVGACRLIHYDYDRMINSAVRGFTGPGFFDRIRRRPSAALLALLYRRLRTYDARRLVRRTANGELLARRLGERVPQPGADLAQHTHWVFPILVDDPRGVVERLQRAGFDATQGQSLCVVDPPADRPHLQALTAEDVLARTVFLPMYPELPVRAIERMAAVVLEACGDRCPQPSAPHACVTTTSAARPAG